jgi:fucose permease
MGCVFFDPVWFYPPIGFATGLFFPGFFVTASGIMGTDSRVAPVILGTCQIGAVLSPLAVAALIPQMGDKGFFWLMSGTAAVLALLAVVFYRQIARPVR